MRTLDCIESGMLLTDIAEKEGLTLPSIRHRIYRIQDRIGMFHNNDLTELKRWMNENGWEVPCLQSQKPLGDWLPSRNMTLPRLILKTNQFLV